MMAASAGHTDTVRTILAHPGTDSNLKSNVSNLHSHSQLQLTIIEHLCTQTGHTALTKASQEDHRETVAVLLTHVGLNCNAADPVIHTAVLLDP